MTIKQFERTIFHTLILVLALTIAGCAADGNSEVPMSGDPEADERAAQRVGSEDDDGKKERAQTLYERLGGEQGIAKIVDEITERVIADPRVNFERRNVRTGFLGGKYDAWEPTTQNIERFKKHMVEFIGLAAGGPAQYTGRDLGTLHKDMRITNAEFDAMVGDIKVSMDRLGMRSNEKRDLLAIIETTRKQIVQEQ